MWTRAASRWMPISNPGSARREILPGHFRPRKPSQRQRGSLVLRSMFEMAVLLAAILCRSQDSRRLAFYMPASIRNSQFVPIRLIVVQKRGQPIAWFEFRDDAEIRKVAKMIENEPSYGLTPFLQVETNNPRPSGQAPESLSIG